MVIDINLLPWRALKRQHQMKQFLLTLILVGFFLLILIRFLLYFHDLSLGRLEKQIEPIKLAIQEVNQALNVFSSDKQLIEAVMRRLHRIQLLQRNRLIDIQLMNCLLLVIPDGAYLISLKRSKNQVILLGNALSHQDILQIVQRLEKIDWINNPQLVEIKRSVLGSLARAYAFKIQFNCGSSIPGGAS